MTKTRAAAVRQRTLVVSLRGRMKNGNKGEKTRRRMRTEGSGGGRRAPAEARAARRGPEKCGTRRRSSAATTTATTTSPRTQPGAAGTRAAEARMREGTEEAAGAAVPLQHAATAAVTTQRGLRVGVGVTEAQIPVTPVTVNKICGPNSRVVAAHLICMFSYKHGSVTLSLTLILAQSGAVVFLMIANIKLNLCEILIGFGLGTPLFNPVFICRFNLRNNSYLYTIPLFLSDIQYRIM